MTGTVLLARNGDIATVTLNYPGRLNALNKPMWQQLGEIMCGLSADDALRCIVLRGAGGKAFAAGADLTEFETERTNAKQAKYYGDLIHKTLQAIAHCRQPTVALIKGVCIGGGLEIAAMCDIRICGEASRFGVPVNRLGFTMACGGLQGLLALAGPAVTLEMLLEGRLFDAQEALRKKLVNRVVPDARVEEEAYACASRIGAGAPLVARWHKQYIERLTVTAKLTSQEWDAGYACFDTEDGRIGVEAFLKKEKPAFRGQ